MDYARAGAKATEDFRCAARVVFILRLWLELSPQRLLVMGVRLAPPPACGDCRGKPIASQQQEVLFDRIPALW